MLEFSAFSMALIILATIFLPRITFIVFWICVTGAVSSVISTGGTVLLAVLGFLVLPRVLVTYFLLEAVVGAPATGSAVYVICIIIAIILDLDEE